VTGKRPKPLVAQVLERSRAHGPARQVLAGYASFGDPDGGSITAGAASVARRAGVSVRTVERYRPRLLKLGELQIVDRGGHGKNVEYRICLPPQLRQVGGSDNGQNRQPGSPSWRSSIEDPPGDHRVIPSSSEVAGARDRRSPIGERMGWGP
jgi:hypothetical protein